MPKSYLLGEPEVYKASLKASMDGFSPDGIIPEDGPATAVKALAAFVPDFDPKKVDPSKMWTNEFAKRANQKYPNG